MSMNLINVVCFQVHTMRSVDNLFLVSAMVTNFDFSPQTDKVIIFVTPYQIFIVVINRIEYYVIYQITDRIPYPYFLQADKKF